MPKNRTQRIVFGIIMSYAMAYGMEVYNVAIREGRQSDTGRERLLPQSTVILKKIIRTSAVFFARPVQLLSCVRR